MTYGSAAAFEGALKEISSKYTTKAKPISALPELKDLRIEIGRAHV